MSISWTAGMRRGVVVGIIAVCGAQAALAGEPKRSTSTPVSTPSPRATTTTATAATRAAEPTYFDIAVPGRGGTVTIYRFNRADRRLKLLERVSATDVGTRLRSFSAVRNPTDAIIVLSPEGGKKPPPPPPNGGDPFQWPVPEAEYQAAMQQLRTLEQEVGNISIGQLSTAAAPASVK